MRAPSIAAVTLLIACTPSAQAPPPQAAHRGHHEPPPDEPPPALRLRRSVPAGRAGSSAFELSYRRVENSHRSGRPETVELIAEGTLTWACAEDGSFSILVSGLGDDSSVGARELESTRYEGRLEADGAFGSLRVFTPVRQDQLSSEAEDIIASLYDVVRRSVELRLPEEPLPVGGRWSGQEDVRVGGRVDGILTYESALVEAEGDGEGFTIETREVLTIEHPPEEVRELSEVIHCERSVEAGRLLADTTFSRVGVTHLQLSQERFSRSEERFEATLSAQEGSDQVSCDSRALIGTCEELPAASAASLFVDCPRAGGHLLAGPCPRDALFGRCQGEGRPPLLLYRPLISSEAAARRICLQVPFVPEG